MDAVDAIYGRRAIRQFKDAPIVREEINELIEAAIQAPSGVNRQPWAFVVIEGRPTLARWSRLAKAHLLQSGALAQPGLGEHLANPDFNIFYNAPALIVICATEADQMSMKDCCLAAQNLMLAAHDRGMGSCWIGFAEAWLGSAEGKAELGVPPNYVPVAPIILGRPELTPPRPHRNPAVVRWVGKVAAPA